MVSGVDVGCVNPQQLTVPFAQSLCNYIVIVPQWDAQRIQVIRSIVPSSYYNFLWGVFEWLIHFESNKRLWLDIYLLHLFCSCWEMNWFFMKGYKEAIVEALHFNMVVLTQSNCRDMMIRYFFIRPKSLGIMEIRNLHITKGRPMSQLISLMWIHCWVWLIETFNQSKILT